MHIRVDGLQKPDRNIKRRSEGVREVEKKSARICIRSNLAKGIRQRTNIDSLNGTLEDGRFP